MKTKTKIQAFVSLLNAERNQRMMHRAKAVEVFTSNPITRAKYRFGIREEYALPDGVVYSCKNVLFKTIKDKRLDGSVSSLLKYRVIGYKKTNNNDTTPIDIEVKTIDATIASF